VTWPELLAAALAGWLAVSVAVSLLVARTLFRD
jgi:hypothetical protein